MRESAQKPFKAIASHLLEHREVAEYEILIEVFVRSAEYVEHSDAT